MKQTAIILILLVTINFAQKKPKKIPHEFTMITAVETTPIKSQGKTGTCWAFATSSFWETELIRLGKENYDISEMYIARRAYEMKAENYIRYHGKTQFEEGGQAHDVLAVIKKYGFVPQQVYPERYNDDGVLTHREAVSVMKGILNGVLKNSGKKISENWKKVINATLDIYFGEVPEKFLYNGKEYTPFTFAKESGLNPDDYVEITSYTHHPFYEKFVLEVPDNWLHGEYYNVPLNDLMKIIDFALENGYSVDWDGDVGKDNFYRKKGYAVVPVDEDQPADEPEIEKIVTQEMRQRAFDSFDVTDDHLMHITGIAKNQKGTKFYYTKNSWGTKEKRFGGFWYMSEPYVRLKTIAIMVHKNAVPPEIRAKLGF